jgi:hypothetical protein
MQQSPWKHKKTIQPYMHSGYHFLRSDAANILRQYDMGGGALYPAAFYENDKTQLVSDQIFLLNIGNQKKTLIAEISDLESTRHDETFYLPLELRGKTLVAYRSALDGPDIWADPRIRDVFFMSDRLVQALTKAKLSRAFRLYPVPVDG